MERPDKKLPTVCWIDLSLGPLLSKFEEFLLNDMYILFVGKDVFQKKKNRWISGTKEKKEVSLIKEHCLNSVVSKNLKLH